MVSNVGFSPSGNGSYSGGVITIPSTVTTNTTVTITLVADTPPEPGTYRVTYTGNTDKVTGIPNNNYTDV